MWEADWSSESSDEEGIEWEVVVDGLRNFGTLMVSTFFGVRFCLKCIGQDLCILCVHPVVCMSWVRPLVCMYCFLQCFHERGIVLD